MEDAAWIDGAGTTGGAEFEYPRHLANVSRVPSGSAHDLFCSSSMQVVWAATTAEPQFRPFEDWKRVTESITMRQGQNSSQGVSGIELGSRRACCKYPIKKTALPVRCAVIESAKPSGPHVPLVYRCKCKCLAAQARSLSRSDLGKAPGPAILTSPLCC